MRLELKEVKTVGVNQNPGNNGFSLIVNIRALLTRPLADQLKCRSLCFDDTGGIERPRQFESLTISNKGIAGCEVTIGCGTFLVDLTNLKVGHPKEKQQQASLELQCSMHFAAFNIEVVGWLADVNKSTYEVSAKPPQEELDLQPAEDGGGDCVDCNNQIGFLEDDPSTHLSGQECKNYRAPEAEAEAGAAKGPVVAPARTMGGTHQRRKREARDPVREGIADGTTPLDEEAPKETVH